MSSDSSSAPPVETLFLSLLVKEDFGKVARCQNLATQGTVAVKILKKDLEYIQDLENEVGFLTLFDLSDI